MDLRAAPAGEDPFREGSPIRPRVNPGPGTTGYVRDSRSPVPTSAAASRSMSGNRAKDTSPELALRRALYRAGIRGYRLHPKRLPGRPDLAFGPSRLAVFVNGCFWHHCATCDLPVPKANRSFWEAKFARNQARDAKKIADLEGAGWSTLTVWEHEVRDDLTGTVRKIARARGVAKGTCPARQRSMSRAGRAR